MGIMQASADFPELHSLKVRVPLESKDWTIWPGPPAGWRDFVVGFPLELHPFAWDYIRLRSDRARVELQPHYSESSFDTFWVDTSGHVTCHALGGLFPFTLGRQPELLDGLRTTLEALPPLVEPSDPAAAKTIAEIAARLGQIARIMRQVPEAQLRSELEDEWQRGRASARGRAAEAFWLAKRERSRRRRS